MQFTLILIHPRRMYFLKKQTSMKKRKKDQKTRWRHPCQPQAALWPGRAQLPPSSRSAPTMKPGGVTSSALPSEPWLQACHGYRLGQRLCGMLPGSCGFTGWEPPARQPHESRVSAAARQADTDSFGWGPSPVVAKVSDFSYKLIWPQKVQRERLSKLGRVCVCMC